MFDHKPFGRFIPFALQVFLPNVGDKKPGMIMGMVLATVPVLGKLLGETRS